MKKKDKYITLKEAAQISGYSSDYVGQLIRKGKLQGRQVFSNVAWMTTEEAIRKYKDKREQNKNKKKIFGHAFNQNFFSVKNRNTKLLKSILYVLIIFLAAFFLFLAYVFSVNFDKSLEKKALESVKNQQINTNAY